MPEPRRIPCRVCGESIPERARRCRHCGEDLEQSYDYDNREGDSTGGVIPYKNMPALIAYYCGVFSILPCFRSELRRLFWVSSA